MTDTPGEQMSEEPQSERGDAGSRDTGSDRPGAGPADRPEGRIDDDAVPSHSDAGDEGVDPKVYGGTGTTPPQDTGSAVPPYEGRKQAADIADSSASEVGGAKVGGASRPVADPEYKSPAPGDTARGATGSPAVEDSGTDAPDREGHDEGVGPAHMPGTGRAEDKI